MRWLVEAVKRDSLLALLLVLSITFIVLDWIFPSLRPVGAKLIADAKREESPEKLNQQSITFLLFEKG
jgi:hypothetical protein